MPNKAPENWKEKTLQELSIFISDGDWIESKNQSSTGIRLIQTGNVGNGFYKNKSNSARYISVETFNKLNCTEIFPGDCLVSRLPDPVGRACIIPNINERMITAVDCSIIRFNQKILYPKYFVYYSMSDIYRNKVIKLSTGSTRLRISRKNLETITLPIPPLSEQERIVQILDEVFENIEKAKQNTLKNLNNAKELFESHLKTFFEKNNSDWREYRLIDITSKIGSGSTPLGGKKSYTNEGISLIRSMNVHDRQFIYEGLAHINEQQANELNGVTIYENDVLLNITGASVARCCVVPNDVIPARVNQHVSIIRPRLEYVSAKFLCYLLTSKYYKDRLLKEGEEGGATRQALTKSGLEQFVISIPEDLNMQEKIVGQLEKIHEYTQKLEQTYNQKLKSLEELKQSILQKAFNGEL